MERAVATAGSAGLRTSQAERKGGALRLSLPKDKHNRQGPTLCRFKVGRQLSRIRPLVFRRRRRRRLHLGVAAAAAAQEERKQPAAARLWGGGAADVLSRGVRAAWGRAVVGRRWVCFAGTLPFHGPPAPPLPHPAFAGRTRRPLPPAAASAAAALPPQQRRCEPRRLAHAERREAGARRGEVYPTSNSRKARAAAAAGRRRQQLGVQPALNGGGGGPGGVVHAVCIGRGAPPALGLGVLWGQGGCGRGAREGLRVLLGRWNDSTAGAGALQRLASVARAVRLPKGRGPHPA
jgi:hypothetical protein